MKIILPNRKEAGRQLARKLASDIDRSQTIVLGLPRGGVPVARAIATNLCLPLDVCLVKKIGLPQNPEVAMGAVAEDALLHDYSGKITIIDRDITQAYNIDREQLDAIAAKVKAELQWRDRCYRNCRPMLKITDRVVIIVDDGIATGLTMHAAIKVLQQHRPAKIIIATPVISMSVMEQLKSQVNKIVYLVKPRYLNAVSFWYKDFKQVSDREVCDLLSQETDFNSSEVGSGIYA